MPIDVETDYEARIKKWKRIYIIFIALMIFISFAILSNVFGIMGENTPFMLEKCRWKTDKVITSGSRFISKDSALYEAKKYVSPENYSEISVTGEMEKCIGWLVEFKINSTVNEKILVCKEGWIYIYSKKCQKKDFISTLKEFFGMLIGE